MTIRNRTSIPWSSATAALLLLVTALPFYPVLLGGRTLTALPGVSGLLPAPPGTVPPPVLDTSSAYIDEPLARLAARKIQGDPLELFLSPPLWNPHCGLGQPLLGNMQSALFSPFRWPILASSSPFVWDLALLFRLLCAALLAFFLARALGLSRTAAFGAGLAFGLSGYLVLHVNMHHLSVEVLFPGLALSILWFLRKPTGPRGLLLALFTWASWVGGNPEATLFGGLLGAVFLLRRPGCPRAGRRRILQVFFWACCGTLLAAPYILPGVEHLLHGYHHHTGATGTDHFRPWTFAGLLAPWYYRSGNSGVISFSPPWIGGGVFLLAVLGTLGREGKGRDFPAGTLALLAGLLLLKGFGLPGLQEIGRLPVLSMLLFHKYGLPAATLCLALLAGRGIQRLQEGEISPRTLFLSGLGLTLLFLALHAWNLARAGGIEKEVTLDLARGGWILLLPGAVLPFLVLPFLKKKGPYPAGAAACFLLGLELVTAVPAQRPERKDPFLPPPFARVLLEEKNQGRVNRSVSFQGILCPNTSAALGLDDLRINDAVIVGRFGRFARACVDGRMQGGILAPGLFPAFQGGVLRIPRFFQSRAFFRQAASEAGQTWRDAVTRSFALGNSVMDALGVNRLLVKEPAGRAGALARARPQRWKLLGVFGGISIYRNLKCPGRAFLPQRVGSAAGPEEALSWITRHREDLLERAVVEGAPPSWLGDQPSSGKDEVECRFRPGGDLEIRVTLGAPRVLVVSEAWYPGRRAILDGKEDLPCRPGDLCMTALQVPAGTHTIRLTLEHSAFRAGQKIGLLGLLLLLFASSPLPLVRGLFKG